MRKIKPLVFVGLFEINLDLYKVMYNKNARLSQIGHP